jgi:hypothetical protein
MMNESLAKPKAERASCASGARKSTAKVCVLFLRGEHRRLRQATSLALIIAVFNIPAVVFRLFGAS